MRVPGGSHVALWGALLLLTLSQVHSRELLQVRGDCILHELGARVGPAGGRPC